MLWPQLSAFHGIHDQKWCVLGCCPAGTDGSSSVSESVRGLSHMVAAALATAVHPDQVGQLRVIGAAETFVTKSWPATQIPFDDQKKHEPCSPHPNRMSNRTSRLQQCSAPNSVVCRGAGDLADVQAVWGPAGPARPAGLCRRCCTAPTGPSPAWRHVCVPRRYA